MHRNATTIELKVGDGGLSIPTKVPKNSKLSPNKHTIVKQPRGTAAGASSGSRHMKNQNTSKTPKRHRSNRKDNIREL